MALVKQVTSLLEQLGSHKHEAVQVLADQFSAMKSVYHNGMKVDEVPDGIIRQKAAIAILEWLHGKPRELQLQMRGDVEDFATMLERFRDSEYLPKTLQKTILGKEIPPALPEPTREERKQAG